MTTVPDSNVRPARRAAGGSARGVGRSAVARLLLCVLDHVSKLDRKLLLLLVVSLMSACIIPAGPDFQDPSGAPNAPPQILNPIPFWGAEATATVAAPQTFTVTVTDINVTDDLHIHWIVDGRLVFSEPSTVHATGAPLNATLMKTITCSDIFVTASSRHPVMAIVADREFVEGDSNLMRVEEPGIAVNVTWTLDLSCAAFR